LDIEKNIFTTMYEDEHGIDIKTPSEMLAGTLVGFGLSIFFLVLTCL
jgi:hypothetical protein